MIRSLTITLPMVLLWWAVLHIATGEVFDTFAWVALLAGSWLIGVWNGHAEDAA